MIATYSVAMAAGRDAGNRSARCAGRTAWSADDYAAAAATFEQIMGDEIKSPCGCTYTREMARKVRASINSQLRETKTGGRKGGRPKGAKDKAPRKRTPKTEGAEAK